MALNTSQVWWASSCVGSITTQRMPRPAVRLRVTSFWIIGMAKAAVLPVPVWAMASTSSPARMGRMALYWMSVGRRKFISSSPRRMVL